MIRMLAVASFHFFAFLIVSLHSAPPTFDFSPYAECTGGLDIVLPRVPPQFSIKAERMLMGWNGTNFGFDSVESYYDSAGQRGTTFLTRGRSTSQFLWDYKQQDAFYISDNLSCTPTPIGRGSCKLRMAVFLADIYGFQSRLQKVSDLCNLTVTPVTYVGEDTIRSIPVRKWKQCAYDRGLNVVSVSYYYTDRTAVWGYALDRPVRFENRMIDKENGSYHLSDSADITHFAEGIDDMSIFLPPSGAFCSTWLREQRAIPQLLDTFILGMITTSQTAKEVHRLTMYADRGRQQVQFVTHTLNGTRFPPPLGRDIMRSFITLHDYNSGLQFTLPFSTYIYGSNGQARCSISRIDRDAMDSRWQDESSSTTVRVQNINQLFSMDQPDWIYIGERDYNAVRCYVWARQQESRAEGLVRVTEVYWMKEDWAPNNVSALYGMMRYRKSSNGSMMEIYTNQISDYGGPGTTFFMPFDGARCLRTPGARPMGISVGVQVQNYPDLALSGSRYSFARLIRNALSSLLGASTLRMTDLELSQGSDDTGNQAHFRMSLLEWTVNVTGSANAPEQRPSEDVVNQLRAMLAYTDVNVTVPYNETYQTVTLLRDSVRPRGSLFPTRSSVGPTPLSKSRFNASRRNPNKTATATPMASPMTVQGYTGGDMTGLAFAMLLISGGAGVAGGYFSHKLKLPFR